MAESETGRVKYHVAVGHNNIASLRLAHLCQHCYQHWTSRRFAIPVHGHMYIRWLCENCAEALGAPTRN